MTPASATPDLRTAARENFDFALMARIYALRMRTLECAVVLHAFADAAFAEALAFQGAIGKSTEA